MTMKIMACKSSTRGLSVRTICCGNHTIKVVTPDHYLKLYLNSREMKTLIPLSYFTTNMIRFSLLPGNKNVFKDRHTTLHNWKAIFNVIISPTYDTG